MNLNRISRLIQLLGALQVGKGQNASELARACQVSRRTIFRDLEVLRSAGVPEERIGPSSPPGANRDFPERGR